MEKTFISDLTNQLRERLVAIEKNHQYLTFLIEKRFANEKLLQLETMHIISSMPGTMDYLPEKSFDVKGREKCDFWFKTAECESWLEIKTRPTNYRKPGHAKAITNGVDGVIEDIERLRRIPDKKSKKYIMFAFYPMFEESYDTFNRLHLKRIGESIGQNLEGSNVHVKTSNGYFDVYIVQL
jgi:hypothetical protein